MGKTIIHCVRHAQGFHNLNAANHALPDPSLTPLGEAQCKALSSLFMPSFNKAPKITHIVASPLRRTLYTALLSFPALISSGLKVIALPEIQETSDLPCDTGSSLEKLQKEFSEGEYEGKLDLHLITPGWNNKQGRWSPASHAIEARALDARVFLLNLSKENNPHSEDREIIVVTHGGYLHYLTEDWDGYGKFTGTGWANTEFRSYELDAQARMTETRESRERRRQSKTPLTEDEQRELRASAEQEALEQGFVGGGEAKL